MRGPSEENDHYLTVRFLPEHKCSYEILPPLWTLLIRSSGRRCFVVECHLNFCTALHRSLASPYSFLRIRYWERPEKNLPVAPAIGKNFCTALHLSISPDRRKSLSQTQGGDVPGPKRSANTVSLVKIVRHCIGIGPTEKAKHEKESLVGWRNVVRS